MNKAVFLDRDGTINVDYGYVYKIEDLKFIDGVIEALQILSNLGYKLIIVTNQSGIGRSFYSDEEYLKFNNHMLKLLRDKNVIIDGVYYCPHISTDNCDCRKPKLKLFYDAIKDFDIDLNNSFVIGDKERDLSICEVENVKGILLTNNKNNKYICKKSLLEAAEYIKEHNGSDN